MPNNKNRKAYNNKSKAIPQGISFSAISSFNQDEMAFLCQLYASSRWEEVLQTAWSDQQRVDFLSQQFEAQHKHYQSHYPKADYLFIQNNNKNIGRIYLDRGETSICLIDIALLPEHKNKGLGTILLKELIKEAQSTNKKVVLHVEKFNPAYHWYLKHGFQQVEDKGVHQYLEYHPKNQDKLLPQ
jgi:ribosomal protein S18 acetylase RimI-like enzyme